MQVPVLPEMELRRLQKLAVASLKMRMEGLKLFEPMPTQKAFLDSPCRERIIYGSNRSGKTTIALYLLASIVTGQDPSGRFPKTDGIFYIVGKDGKHLGNTIYRKLLGSECFKIIRDKTTKEWRAFRPYLAEDKAREHEARWAPPLIPPRMIKETSWESKKDHIPKMVRLTNGWEIHFFSGNARPPQGSSINGSLFDEEVPDKGWYEEIAARLVDRRGLFIWSATPESGTDQLLALHERAEGELHRFIEAGIKPSIEEFFAVIADNQHISDQDKAEFEAKLTPEQARVKIYGQFVQLGATMFPEFSRRLHVYDYFAIPLDWTRYVYVDPGRQICAVLFMAVPDPRDPKHADYRYVYDELYIPDCHADLFGQKMRSKCEGQDFETFVIDEREARKASAGDGKTLAQHYSDALKKYEVRSRLTGHGFVPGSDSPTDDVEAIRGWLRDRHKLGPILRVFDKTILPNFHYEIVHWRRKKDAKGNILDEPESRGRVHLMAGLRGLVQHNPQWQKPRGSKQIDTLRAILDADRKAERAMYGGDGPAVYCGPRGSRVGVGA